MTPIFFAYLGLAFMVTLSSIGSAWGLANCGNAVVGALKKRPEALGSYVALSALPSTQGLYGFVAFYLVKDSIVDTMSIFAGTAILFGGVIMGVLGLLSAIRQAEVCANGIVAVSQGHNVVGGTLTMAVFPELYAIIGLLTVIFINGMI